ncbi:hypothetical protein FB446DRAFT_434971 [Lentinula raphanica]|nr:hypothetical protein FB446DRAFT_434971 [Lentinula raphanica]
MYVIKEKEIRVRLPFAFLRLYSRHKRFFLQTCRALVNFLPQCVQGGFQFGIYRVRESDSNFRNLGPYVGPDHNYKPYLSLSPSNLFQTTFAESGECSTIHDPEKILSLIYFFMARTKVQIIIPSRNSAEYTRTVWGAVIPPSPPVEQMKRENSSRRNCTVRALCKLALLRAIFFPFLLSSFNIPIIDLCP